MTPEERLARLEAQIDELSTWKAARELQAIPFPLDEASRSSLGTVRTDGTLSSGLTQSVAVATTPASNITVPAAYAGVVLVNDGSATYKVPHLGTI